MTDAPTEVKVYAMSNHIGFVGLGIMGKPMAQNLLKAGRSVVAYDIAPAALEDVVAAGAQPASSPKDVASRTASEGSPKRASGG